MVSKCIILTVLHYAKLNQCYLGVKWIKSEQDQADVACFYLTTKKILPNSGNYSLLGITLKKTEIPRNTAVTTSHLERIQGHTVNFHALSPTSLNITVVSFKNNYGRSLQDWNIVRPYPVSLSWG